MEIKKDKLIMKWERKAKELDTKAIDMNGKGATTVMGREAMVAADTFRECIKDLQKEKNK